MANGKFKNILITNSGSSLGKGLAWLFAEAGHKLILHAKDEDVVTLAKEISQKHRVQVAYSFAELSDPEQIKTMITNGENKLGNIEGVVNLVDMEYNAPVEEFPLDKWQLMFQYNLTNTFLVTKMLWKRMKKQKFGRIVNITSPYSLTATEYKSAYITCCHGISGMTKAFALEGARFGITCNTIAPGKVRTQEVEEEISDHKLAHNISEAQVIQKIILKNHPDKSFVDINNIGVCALYLLSDYGSSVNGITLPVDGGWTI